MPGRTQDSPEFSREFSGTWPLFFFLGFSEIRCSKKNFCSRERHSASHTLRVISQRWFREGNCNKFIAPPAAPAFGSLAPNTTRARRVCTIAPAHMGQGSL